MTEGLRYFQETNAIHLDKKPQNNSRLKGETIKITDFDLEKMV